MLTAVLIIDFINYSGRKTIEKLGNIGKVIATGVIASNAGLQLNDRRNNSGGSIDNNDNNDNIR